MKPEISWELCVTTPASSPATDAALPAWRADHGSRRTPARLASPVGLCGDRVARPVEFLGPRVGRLRGPRKAVVDMTRFHVR